MYVEKHNFNWIFQLHILNWVFMITVQNTVVYNTIIPIVVDIQVYINQQITTVKFKLFN